MNLSKSKYCSGVQCDKILWLDKNKNEVKEEIDNSSVLDNGTDVGELAKRLFGEFSDVEFNTNLNQMIEDTKKLLKKDIINITEASFNYNNNFCSVDILKKNNDIFEIYEVKSSTEISDIYLEDISYQYYVLNNLGYKVKRCYIVHINSSYVRHGKLELDKLFKIVDVTDIVFSKQDKVKEKINEINEYMQETDEPYCDIGIQCVKPYDCPYFKYCSSHIESPNVFNIRGMQISKKFDLYHNGIYTYNNLLNENINPKYKEQIEYELYNKKDKINVLNIREFMSTLSYPIYFLDFETYQQSIPLYDNISPYMQIPFQYSLHYIEEENGEVKHTDFLAEKDIDPRYSLASKLVRDIPSNTCVVAYNMSFEKSVIRNLAKIYPDLKDKLMNIHDNMKDLMIPFKNRDYYTKNMYGSYSIKYVLPALFPDDPSLNYHNLEMVHNGSEASNAYASLGKLSLKEQEVLRENMLKYCELDTYAMVKIFNKLKKI